jgi:hypothetical protein
MFQDALMNCLICPKSTETDTLFYQDGPVIRCHLDGYAIVPREEYERLVGHDEGEKRA